MKKKAKPVRIKDLKPAKGGTPKGGRITNTRANASTVGGGGGATPVVTS